MRKHATLALIALIACAWVAPLAAQGPATVANGTLDLAVPESPAFTVLNLNPQDVVRPATPTALVTSLLNGVDKAGNFKTGFAIDTAPYLLWKGRAVTLQSYRASAAIRFFTRAQVSGAVVKGASADDKSAKVGMGANLTIFNLDDPRTNDEFARALAAAGDAALNGLPPLGPTATAAQVDAYQQQITDLTISLARQARERWRRQAWNPTSLVVGFAGEWESPAGRVQDIDGRGGSVWASMGYGFKGVPGLQNSAHVIVHGRMRSDLSDAVAASSPGIRERWMAGARLRLGAENGSLSLEGTRYRPLGRDAAITRMSLAVERRVMDKTWLELAVGGDSGTAARAGTFVMSNLKWSLANR